MLTSHDLEKIGNLIKDSEERVTSKIIRQIELKIDQRSDEIIEYIDSNIENHEKRIAKLEDDCSVMQQQLK